MSTLREILKDASGTVRKLTGRKDLHSARRRFGEAG